jgi:hypothetical protein
MVLFVLPGVVRVVRVVWSVVWSVVWVLLMLHLQLLCRPFIVHLRFGGIVSHRCGDERCSSALG